MTRIGGFQPVTPPIVGEPKNQAPFTRPIVKPTPGKTPLPTRTVLLFAKPRAQPRVPKSRQAPALTPQQLAQQAVAQSLAPLYGQARTNEAMQQAAVESFTKALLAAVGNIPQLTQADYSQAEAGQSAIAQAAGNALAAANPNSQIQQGLGVIGAPGSQQQAVADQLRNAFQGGGAVQMYTGGVLPVGNMAADEAAALTNERQLPAIEALRGQDALQQVLGNYQSQINQLAAQQPDLVQKYLASYTTAQNDRFNQRLKLAQLGLSQAKTNASISATNARLGLTQNAQTISERKMAAQQQQFVEKQTQQLREFNAKQGLAQTKLTLPDSALSAKLGVLVNSAGQEILRGGKPVVLPGFRMTASGNVVKTKAPTSGTGTTGQKLPTANEINTMINAWKNGKPVTVHSNGTTSTAVTGQMSYMQAYKRLMTMGVSDQQARSYLDTAYKRGEQGRAWLTNAEQQALAASRLAPRASKYKGNAYLTVQQAKALEKAGRLPAGEAGKVAGRSVYWIAPTY